MARQLTKDTNGKHTDYSAHFITINMSCFDSIFIANGDLLINIFFICISEEVYLNQHIANRVRSFSSQNKAELDDCKLLF